MCGLKIPKISGSNVVEKLYIVLVRKRPRSLAQTLRENAAMCWLKKKVWYHKDRDVSVKMPRFSVSYVAAKHRNVSVKDTWVWGYKHPDVSVKTPRFSGSELFW